MWGLGHFRGLHSLLLGSQGSQPSMPKGRPQKTCVDGSTPTLDRVEGLPLPRPKISGYAVSVYSCFAAQCSVAAFFVRWPWPLPTSWLIPTSLTMLGEPFSCGVLPSIALLRMCA